MKLYVDNNFNINILKIVSVAEFCQQNITIEVFKSSDSTKCKRFPYFETKDGTEYFSSNACCRYIALLSGIKISLLTETWLEWEAVSLQPSLLLLLKASKGEALQSELKDNLSYLDAVLEKQDYLSSSGSLGLEDIAVWSNLYCLQLCSSSEFAKFLNIQKWLSCLKKETTLVAALTKALKNFEHGDLKKAIISSSASSSSHARSFTPVDIPGFAFSKLSISDSDQQEMEEVVKDVTAEEISSAYESWLKGAKSLPALKVPEKPILPKKGENNILITSALPYVNNVPHLGNIIGAVLSADVFTRYCRLRGYNTLYVCGTDEYGTATETKAIEMGVTPKEICDKYNKLHDEIYQWFNISFDYFGRTTTDQQTVIAQDIFNKLLQQDLLLVETVEQLYCAKCERFLADRFVEGTCPLCSYEDARGDQCDKCGKLINAADLKNPQCKVCRSTPHIRASRHLFLDLPKLEPALKQQLDQITSVGQWSNTAKVIAYSWLKEGLKPRCITRDLKWGTPVPLEGFTDKVFYVWYDAPIGYLSITANYTAEWEQWWKNPSDVQLYQFMAKDNVPFHSIIFPACQIGTKDNYTMVNHLAATEYLNYEDVKFSKSRGVGVFGDDAKNTGIPSDIWRFYLLYIRPESQDTFFSWSDLMLKNNSELLNNLGNFINRALSFISNNFGGIIPEMTLGDNEKILLAQVDRELKSYITCLEKTRLRDSIKHILNISRTGNQYIQSNKPWVLVKGTAEERALAGTVLGLSANICCLLCTLIEPYMPDTFAILKDQLQTKPNCHVLIDEFVCLLSPGHIIGSPVPLFQKIDQEHINQLKMKYAGQQQTPENVVAEKASKVDPQASGEQAISNSIDATEIENLNTLVTEQGNRVRQLKTDKASKPDIDKEVAILLELKKKLAVAKGENPEQPPAKSKSKKKSSANIQPQLHMSTAVA